MVYLTLFTCCKRHTANSKVTHASNNNAKVRKKKVHSEQLLYTDCFEHLVQTSFALRQQNWESFGFFVKSVRSQCNWTHNEAWGEHELSLHLVEERLGLQKLLHNAALLVPVRERFLRHRNIEEVTQRFPTIFEVENQQLLLGNTL